MTRPINAADLEPWHEILPFTPTDPRTVPVRHSNLKAMAQSPAHYRAACSKNLDATLSMRIGSGTHALLFDQPVAVWTGKVRNGKKWEEFEKRYTVDEPATIINVAEYRQAVAMVNSIRECKPAMRILEELSDTERRLSWHALCDREAVSTPDGFSAKILAELKSTRCSHPSRFSRDGWFRFYHAQLAFYFDAIMSATAMQPREFYIVAVENSSPFVTTVLRVKDEAIDEGRKLNRLWLERVLACEAANEWPGYVQDVVDFESQMYGDGEGFGLSIEGVEVEV